MNQAPVKKVVIVGGGTAGWMAAASLARVMGPMLEIQLVESADIGTVGVGEATIPQIKLLTRLLGLDENDFLSKTQGTIKLGIQFHDWRRPGDIYMHAFGDIGMSLGMLNFHHYWLRGLAEGFGESLWDYSLNFQTASANRFDRLDRVGETPLAGLAYAYHFDASLVAKYLRQFSEENGVTRTEGKIVETNLRDTDGFIESLTLENGNRIAGDLFIDCSGFRGLLIEQALETGYEDWSHWLPVDRAVAVPCESTKPLRPYTQAFARHAGWQWRIPLQQRTGNGHVYSSAYMEDDEAASMLLDNLDGERLAEPLLLKFTTGRRKKFWNKNCVALGLASGFMEPLESTSIHLVQSGLDRLIRMFPDKSFPQAEIDEYNRQAGFEFERIRDFLILHYHANERTDSPFWIERREMPIPESLSRKMELFRGSGLIHREAEELFTDMAWLQVMIGQGIIPQRHHPLAGQITVQQLDQFMGGIRKVIAKAVDGLPTHREFIQINCAVQD
jgi:tryptophan halogenase